MLSYGNSIYNYNARGSLTFKVEDSDTTFYTYDLMGNLTSVVLPNGNLIEYLIDAQNRRIGKKLNGVVQKQWIYQDQLNPVAELDGSGNLEQHLHPHPHPSRHHGAKQSQITTAKGGGMI